MSEGPYARISVLRPHDGDTVDFEAGYIRHLDWHRHAKDTWVWYGWTIWAGERQRSLVYATFGHSAAALDSPVSPADDERDNIVNVTPHGRFMGHSLFEYLPALSRGDADGIGQPQPTPRVEMVTVDLKPDAANAFEAAIEAARAGLQRETLWYRLIAGGTSPRYVRLRARPNLSALLSETGEAQLPVTSLESISKVTVEIMTLRPPMCYGVAPA